MTTIIPAWHSLVEIGSGGNVLHVTKVEMQLTWFKNTTAILLKFNIYYRDDVKLGSDMFDAIQEYLINTLSR